MMKIAEIIRLSWNLYISKLKKYLPLLLISSGLSMSTSLLNFYLIDFKGYTDNWVIILTLVISFLISIISFGVTIAIVLYTNKFLDNKKDSDIKLSNILSVFWPALWISFVAGIITVAGYILFVVPGILFTVWFAFALYIAVLEKKSGFAILKESKELSKGRFWQILGRIIIPSLFWGLIAYLVLAGLINLLGLISGQAVLTADATSPILAIAVILITTLVSTFFFPLYLIVANIIYREVKK